MTGEEGPVGGAMLEINLTRVCCGQVQWAAGERVLRATHMKTYDLFLLLPREIKKSSPSRTDSPVSTPKASGIKLISPTTPCTSATSLTPGGTSGLMVTPSTLATPGPGAVLSQTLSTIIDHTSILLEQQQKLLAQEATPTSLLPAQAVSGSVS